METKEIKKEIPTKSWWDEMKLAYEIDICEIFGGAGDGKSQTVKQIALEEIAKGKKVCFVDTERGFLKTDIAKLGSAYRYIPNLKGLMDFAKNLPKEPDLIIIDSVGYPVLTEWAKLGVNEKGNSLTQIIAIKDMLKDWAINNNKQVIVTNQPDSDFGKAADYINRPFGDKGQFVIKEVFKIERIKRDPNKTISVLKAFRSRHDGFGTQIASVEITSEGVKFI